MRLRLRITTDIGPRTIMTQQMNDADAIAIKHAVERIGGEAFIAGDESRPVLNWSAARRREKASA